MGAFAVNVLIDNSTYLSCRAAIEEGLIDPYIIYNMASFLECLVVADKVFLAPSTLWHPGSGEGYLFSETGPCAQLPANWADETSVRQTFRQAIAESKRDLAKNVIRDLFPVSTTDLEEAERLLRVWRIEANRNPQKFVETYSQWYGESGSTDRGTIRFLDEARCGPRQPLPTYRHLAHFLLRCNVAMEMSERLVYHPHSHRTRLVCEKMALKARESASLVSALVRDTEATIEKKISENARRTILSRYGAFNSVDSDLPLVLAVVLSGARTPADVIPLALNLRNTRAAKRYRDWTTKLVSAVRKGSTEEQIKAARELEQAKQVLTEELTKLYDARRKTDLSRFAALASVADPEPLLSTSVGSVLIKAGKKFVEAAPELLRQIEKMHVRRKVALLLNLAKKRRQIERLNLLLERTFRKKLSQEQLIALNTLRLNQGKLMNQLIQEGS
jgi:hypothetical protein